MPTDPANIRTAIVLQGGGALGAYELGVLKAIYDQRPVRSEKDYQNMLGHRRIDSFKVIEANLDHDLANASDFSRSSVEARIETGYDDAKRQDVAWYLS